MAHDDRCHTAPPHTMQKPSFGRKTALLLAAALPLLSGCVSETDKYVSADPFNVRPSRTVLDNGPYAVRLTGPVMMVTQQADQGLFWSPRWKSRVAEYHSYPEDALTLGDMAYYFDDLQRQQYGRNYSSVIQGDEESPGNFTLIGGMKVQDSGSALFGFQSAYPELFNAYGKKRQLVVKLVYVMHSVDNRPQQSDGNQHPDMEIGVYLCNGKEPMPRRSNLVIPLSHVRELAVSGLRPSGSVSDEVVVRTAKGNLPLTKLRWDLDSTHVAAATLVELLNSLPEEHLRSFPYDE